MPELPEVECVRRDLERAFVKQKIVQVWHQDMPNLLDKNSLPVEFLDGQILLSIERKGKYMHWVFERFHMLAHLGMSGVFGIQAEPTQHTHLKMTWNNQIVLSYTDPRRFGYFNLQLRSDPFERWELLGPDALAASCSAAYLAQKARGSSVAIKTWIMDQSKLAGVGNIYACESLFNAKIHPNRLAGSVQIDEWKTLVRAIKSVMRASIIQRGTTFSDYRLTNGKGGAFQSFLKVFQKDGQACPHCAHVIQKTVLQGRSTFACPQCQK